MTQTQAPTNPWPRRIGIVLTVLPTLMLLMSAGMKFSNNPEVLENFKRLGFGEHVIVPLGIVELVSTILYAVPATAVLGAILVTGYLGGAVCTHLRVDEPFLTPVILGVIAWAGLYLRDPRLRALLPLR